MDLVKKLRAEKLEADRRGWTIRDSDDPDFDPRSRLIGHWRRDAPEDKEVRLMEFGAGRSLIA